MSETITATNLITSNEDVLQTSQREISNPPKINQPSKLYTKDRHLQKSCPVCCKSMRSNKINRHLKTHNAIKSKYLTTSCNICEKIMRKDNLKRHLKTHEKTFSKDETPIPQSTEQDIVSLLKDDQKLFNAKLQTGSFVKNALLTQNIEPHSLRKEMREALDIHDCHTKPDMNNCTLKSWQQEVLTLMETPSSREIIWIIGQHGNEGKTWLQKYIEHHFGIRRVFRTSIVKDVSSLLHMLSKRTLTCTDIFLINISRSFDIVDVPYTLLEDIKDGQASSSKYNSKILKICTPNVLVVFSNYWPLTNKLSNDRLKRYMISETSGKLILCDNFKRALTVKEMKQYRKNLRASKQDSDEEG